MLSRLASGGQHYVSFFGEMKIDLARKLLELWKDVKEISDKNGYLSDIEFNVISLYQEEGDTLYVIKIATGRDGHVRTVRKLVFKKPKAEPQEEYDMIGTDGTLPIWKSADTIPGK